MTASATKDRDWLSASEVADFLDVTSRTVCRWINSGVIPGYKMPGPKPRHRIRKSEFLLFVQQRPELHWILKQSWEEFNGRRSITVGDNEGTGPSEGHQADQGATGDERGAGCTVESSIGTHAVAGQPERESKAREVAHLIWQRTVGDKHGIVADDTSPTGYRSKYD